MLIYVLLVSLLAALAHTAYQFLDLVLNFEQVFVSPAT